MSTNSANALSSSACRAPSLLHRGLCWLAWRGGCLDALLDRGFSFSLSCSCGLREGPERSGDLLARDDSGACKRFEFEKSKSKFKSPTFRRLSQPDAIISLALSSRKAGSSV